MKSRLFYIISFSLLLLFGCKKDELPPDISTPPEFTAEFIFDGASYTHAAGENGLVQTNSYTLSDSGIVLNSAISNPECEGCGPALSLRLKSPASYNFTNSAEFPAQLEAWLIKMILDDVEISTLQLTANTGNLNNAGLWFLNGESLGDTPTDSISFSVTDPGLYTILYNTAETCDSASASQVIEFDGSNLPCYGNIKRFLPDSLPFFAAQAGPEFNLPTTTYEWTFGDFSINTGISPYLYYDTLSGYDQACVTMNDSQGCFAEVCMAALPNDSLCNAGIFIESADISTEIIPDEAAYLILEYTDENDIIYTSENENQTDASVSLVSLEAYTEPTRPGEKFLKAVIEINCMLYNPDGEGFAFSGNLEVAFGYP